MPELDRALLALAEAAGIATRWTDVHGTEHAVAPDGLRALLAALGFPAATLADIADGRAALAAAASRLPPLLTADAGPDGVAIPGALPGTRFLLTLEEGGRIEGLLEQGWGGEARLPALHQPGYHALELPEAQCRVAVAPARCFGLEESGAGERPWGLAVQLYALRRRGDLGIGDFGAVGEMAAEAARHGAACLAISPVHALFAADPQRFSPYAPSSRLFLNTLHADAEAALGPVARWPDAEREALDLIDWPGAAAAKRERLRTLFERHREHPGLAAFRAAMGPALEDHARFEALHAAQVAAGRWHWRDWPEAFRHPAAPGVAAFARDHAGEVAFHAFCQWLADTSLAGAQRACREAGMAVGLIADLAIGTDSGGSHAWSRQREILPDLAVGAPPDIFSPLGQDWGLTAFSPRALAEGGFAAFLELLRASMRHAGGIRVDHLMGLARLWMVPRGAAARDGAYLRFPLADLLRLLALESRRHRCIVVGEDLGTVPEGFRDQVAPRGILGMRVLWFERDEAGAFTPPAAWSREAVAMTTTHDLPTVAGWWQGRDIGWRDRLGLFGDAARAAVEAEERGRDRAALWRAMGGAGDPPPAEAPGPAIDAALAHVAGAACDLALLPVEDALALEEQPNLPGTLDQHPNWRRRLPRPVGQVLAEPAAARRVAAFAAARGARGVTPEPAPPPAGPAAG